MPPHFRLYFRTGHVAGEGEVCCRPDRYSDAEGWPPSDHLHAVRPCTVQYERPDDDRDDALRTQGNATLHEFRMAPELTEITIQDVYAALVDDVSRNEMITDDVVRAVRSGRCPLLLTGRTEHLQFFASRLAGVAKHVFVLKGGMG